MSSELAKKLEALSYGQVVKNLKSIPRYSKLTKIKEPSLIPLHIEENEELVYKGADVNGSYCFEDKFGNLLWFLEKRGFDFEPVIKMREAVYLTQLIDIIHFTIIQKRGKNDIALQPIRQLHDLIRTNQLENYNVTDVSNWQELFKSQPEM